MSSTSAARPKGYALSRVNRNAGHRVPLARLISYVVLALGSVVMVFPFVWMIASSLKVPGQINATPPVWIPNPVTTANYAELWATIDVPRLYANSLFLSSLITLISVYTSALVGYVLAKYEFRGRETVFLGIIATMMVPWAVTLVPTYMICSKLGLIGHWGGIIVPGIYSTFGIFMMRQSMHGIPSELCDASRIDGCDDWGTFHRIVLPNATASLSALGIFSFMWNWDSFLWPLIVLSNEKLYTLPIGMAYFVGRYWSRIGPILACATIGVVPVLVVFFFLQRYIVEGVTLTGMKG